MKVTKAKGLNTIRPARFGKRVRLMTVILTWELCASNKKSKRVRIGGSYSLLVLDAQRSKLNRSSPTEPFCRSAQAECLALCFGDFHLGQQMKVTGHAGPGPGAVPHAEKNQNEAHG